ncbi:MAG TPA: hypothetical protein VII94_03580 [Candidatus Saccharimonadales bacterium]
MKAIYLVMAICLLAMCDTQTPTKVVPAVDAPASPSLPICTHQNCFERPSGLDCTGGAGMCYHYVVQYERHCDCDQWAPIVVKDAS